MTNSEIKTFYDEINNISSFARISKIYELTNNLDPYLLYHLKRDFMLHHFTKLKNVITEHGERTEQEILGMFDGVLTNYDFENYLESFDFSFQGEFEQDSLYEMYDEINDFIFEIEDLEKYLGSSKTIVPTRATIEGIDHLGIGEPLDYGGMDADDWYELQDKLEDERIEAEEKAWKEAEEKAKNEQYEQPIEEQIGEPVNVSISMKIIYLEKLGIIDFLKKDEPFNMSTNSLAKVVSRIIGAKAVSVQPCLNAMLSKNVDNKNNPLNSETNVEAVEYYLSKLGYKLRKNKL